MPYILTVKFKAMLRSRNILSGKREVRNDRVMNAKGSDILKGFREQSRAETADFLGRESQSI